MLSEASEPDFTYQLQNLMQRVGFSSFNALIRSSGVSQWQLTRLRKGEIHLMRLENLLKLTQALQVPLPELVATFSQVELAKATSSQELEQANAQLKQEYQRLQAQLQEQGQVMQQEFQQSCLQVLESWLIQWPTAAQKAKENPQLSAVKLLPLLRPLENLLQQWGVEAIAPVGTELPYDPQQHQLMEGTAQPGEPVKVRYTGYHQGDKLLYRAKVSPAKH